MERNVLNRFKDTLGIYCSINQFVELSKRSFVHDHQSEINNRDSFIFLAEKHHIALTSYNADNMVHLISLSYVVNINICFETFLKEIYRHIKSFGTKTTKEKMQDESWLICIINNIYGSSRPENIISLIEICEYYRLIRNTAVHDLIDIQTHLNAYRKLSRFDYKKESKFKRLDAPNELSKISFDDSVMFARSCTELATILYNDMEYDFVKIVNSINHDEVRKFVKYKENRKRGEQSLHLFLKTKYKDSQQISMQIAGLYDSLLARSSSG